MRTALILRAVNMLGLPMMKVEENYELDRLTLTLRARCSDSISLPQGYSTLLAGDNAESIGDNAESIGDNAETTGVNAESIEDNAKIAGDNAETTGDNAESIEDNAESIRDNAKVSPNGAEVSPNGAEVSPNGAEVSPNGAEVSPNGAEVSPNGAEVSPNGAEVSPNGAEVSPNGAETSPNGAEVNVNGAENTSLNKRYIRKQDSNNLMLQTLRESCELIAREISFEINLSLRRIRELLSESVKLGKIVTYGSNEKRNICFTNSLSLRNAWKQYEYYQVATLPHPILSISVNADSYEIPNQKRCFLRRKEEWQR